MGRGLLSDVLPFVYSQGDRAKRYMNGLLADPVGTLQQTAGGIVDAGREQQGLLGRAFADPAKPFRITDSGALNQAVGNVMAGPMGFAPAGIMAGIGAKTANWDALKKATDLEQAGASPADIWKMTGWGKGPDGHWRFEIDDRTAGMRLNGPKFGTQDYTPFGETLSHPEAFKAYPDAKSISTTWHTESSPYYTRRGPMEYINLHQPQGDPQKNASYSLHELQHAIQEREGFAEGGAPGDRLTQAAAQRFFDNAKPQFSGNPEDLMKMAQHRAYLNLGGEAEARLVQARKNMTPAERAAQFPWEPGYFSQATGSPLDSLILGN